MAIAGTVMFSSAPRVADASAPAVTDADASLPATADADSGESRESFDTLMNSLLGAASTAASVPDGTEAAGADTLDGAAPAVTDAVADIDVMADCLPVPPTAESLPPAGNILPSADTGTLVPSLPESAPETPGTAEGRSAEQDTAALAPPYTLLPGAASRLPTDAPEIAPAYSARPVMSCAAPAAAAQALKSASSPAPSVPSAGDMNADSMSPDAPLRVEQLPQARADSPLTADARTGGAGHQPASPDGDTQGQAHLQELLTRLGASGDASRTPGDAFRSLLQGAEGGTPSNTGALTYAQAGPAGPARDPAGPSLPVHTPLRHPEWSDEVSQRIRWAIGNQVHTAELKINPPQLGPVEVRVSVDADRQMTVTLSSQHALVRETLTDSLPRLRDLMSEHGFGAVSVDVSQHSSPDGRQRPALAETDPAARVAADADADRETEASALPRNSVRGLVDLYA